ncbi:hypothetical protein E2C01_060065 [Portunus trituberculatus]|uniref:Uncharacterized protein n=1 Tax=Portunus trituberculatus TaxID=210409 RepID=A0A5B7HAD1_PORTR|nr:hypothetical protein [Portunus trituberculatus]
MTPGCTLLLLLVSPAHSTAPQRSALRQGAGAEGRSLPCCAPPPSRPPVIRRPARHRNWRRRRPARAVWLAAEGDAPPSAAPPGAPPPPSVPWVCSPGAPGGRRVVYRVGVALRLVSVCLVLHRAAACGARRGEGRRAGRRARQPPGRVAQLALLWDNTTTDSSSSSLASSSSSHHHHHLHHHYHHHLLPPPPCPLPPPSPLIPSSRRLTSSTWFKIFCLVVFTTKNQSCCFK